MSDLTLRGRDLALCIDRRRVSGVLSLDIRKNAAFHEYKEYLSDSPVSKVKTGEKYLISLTVTPVFDAIKREPFTVSIKENGEERHFENCFVSEKKTEYSGDKLTKISYLIESDRIKGGGSCGK